MLRVSTNHVRSGLLVAAIVLLASPGLGAAPADKPGHLALVQASPAGLMLKRHPAGAWEEVTGELRLLPGASLKTGAAGVGATLTDGTRVDIGASSIVQFHVPTEINLEAGPTTRVARMDIREGSVRVVVPPRGRPLLLMASKDLYAAFRPGSARARVAPEGLIVAVDDGGAKVAASGRWTPLPAGQYQVLRSQGAQEGPKPLPPKVSFVSEPCRADASKACAIALLVGESSAKVGVRWNPIAGFSYAVELMRDRDGGPSLKRLTQPADQTSFASEPLPAGSYVLSVQTVSPEGVEGARVLRPLKVVRMIPETGVTWVPDAQVFVVPRGRKVALAGTAGVQVRAGQTFLPAPATLQLGQDAESRSVRLRVEGDGTDEASVTLERSALRADVKLGPMTARWPQDNVELRVQMQDPRGRIDARALQPRTRVRVNEALVQVGLVRDGDWWTASIPARSGDGPWAIRVEVLDAENNQLGYGMLNVVGKEDRRRRGLW